MHRLINLALGLDADVPLTSNTGHGDTFDSAALAIVSPAQLGKFDAAITSIEFAILGETEATTDTLFFEAREVSMLLEKIFVTTHQIFERKLIYLRWRFLEPQSIGFFFPD